MVDWCLKTNGSIPATARKQGSALKAGEGEHRGGKQRAGGEEGLRLVDRRA